MNVTAAGQMANPPLPPPVAFVGLASGNNFRCCTTGEGVPERAVVCTVSSIGQCILWEHFSPSIRIPTMADGTESK